MSNLGWFDKGLAILRDNPFLGIHFGSLLDDPNKEEEKQMEETVRHPGANVPEYLKCGYYNLKVARNDAKVKREVTEFFHDNELDIFAVQEAMGYWGILHEIPGTEYISGDRTAGPSAKDSGILVRNGVRHGPGHVVRLSTTEWKRWEHPGMHWGRSAAMVTAYSILFGSIHMPPGGLNPNGPRHSPLQVKSYQESIRSVQGLLNNNDEVCLQGDWNGSRAILAPRLPGRIEGEGIDLLIYKGVKIDRWRKHRFGGSDHNPCTYRVKVPK